MGITKVRANQIFGIIGYPAPYISEITPASIQPSETAIITIKGAFFTPTMTVSVVGHTINVFNFKSNSEILINITAPATEGNYNLTLNNGASVTFSAAIIVSVGIVTVPVKSSYYNITGNIDLETQGFAKVESTAAGGSADFFDFPINANYAFEYKWVKSVLYGGSLNSPTQIIELIDKVDGTSKLGVDIFNNTQWTRFYVNGSVVKNSDTSQNLVVRIERINGVVTFKINGSPQYTASPTITNALKLRVNIRYHDITQMKLIQIP